MIVFLDKDGVFEHHRAYMAGLEYDPIAARVLSALFSRPDVQVVISATFRKIHTRESAIEHLAERGITCNLHEDWRTGYGETRTIEVANWLAAHGNPEDYLMIDDEPCVAPLDPSKWVRCCHYNGMSVTALIQVEKITGIEYGVSQYAKAQRMP